MTIDASTLDVTLEPAEDCLRRLRVTVPAEVVASERSAAVQRYARRVKLKGFRKGRVPADVVERQYGETIRSETLNRVVGEAYRVALQREDLHPVTDGNVHNVDWKEGTPLTFQVEFEVRPEPELSRVGGFKLSRVVEPVPEERVDQVVERLRFQQGVWSPAEGTPEDGDLVDVEITPLEGSEGGPGEPRPYELVLGEGDALPDVEAAIRTLEPEQSGEFTVRFPDDFQDEVRRGTEHRLLIRLGARKVRELPTLDDEFARSLGDFESLDALRARVAEDLQKEVEEEAEARLRGQLLDRILEANPFPVPSSMVQGYVESLLGDVSEADPERVKQASEELRPGAERAVKRFVVLDHIAEREGLAATKEEIDARIQEIAERNDQEPGQVVARLRKAGRLESLVREMTEEKVFAFLKEQSEITSTPQE